MTERTDDAIPYMKKYPSHIIEYGQTKEELRPCPFCGSDAVLQNPGPLDQWRVVCTNHECGARIYAQYANRNGRAMAMKMWNKRASE